MGYTGVTIKGVSWVGALRFVTRIVAFFRTAVLARILSPSQFGAYAIASLVVSLLEVATETGVNVILVQDKEGLRKYLNSAWIISITRGFIVGFFILLSAPFVAIFFNSKDAFFLVMLISIVPIIRGFINPSVIKFQKELLFHKEFLYRFSIFFVDGLTAVVMAFFTKSASSIIFGLIAGVTLEAILSFIVVRPHPVLRFEIEFFKKILSRGKWVTASGIFNYLFHNLDDIVVGKVMGTTTLGLYGVAYSISTLPITEIADVFSRVTFPVFSRISTDLTRLKNAFLKTIVLISLFSVPVGVLLYFFPTEIVKITLGEKWIAIVPALQILGIFGVVRAITGSTSTLFLSVGKQEYVTFITLISLLTLAVLIIPLVVQFGIVGASLAALAGSLVPVPIMLYFTLKVLKGYEKS